MRQIKVAAIQPCMFKIPPHFLPYSDKFIDDTQQIIENYVKKQLIITIRLLEKAGAEGCDIVTTCEDAAAMADFSLDISEKNVFPKLVELSQPIVEKAYSTIAKKYSMYIIGCYLVKHDNLIYNAASVFDRNGKKTGEYKKTHLPANEKWKITPGDSIDVFELDFGKIGICICYDMMFPETVQVLASKGAEIIFHPTFGYSWYDDIGEAALRVRANDNGVYIVTSKNYKYNAAGKSSIIDYWGHVLADAGFSKDVIVTKEIDLDIKKEQPPWYFNSCMTGITNLTDRMRLERRPEIYSIICEQTENLKIPDKEQKQKIINALKNGECRWQ